jgi:hypothetical protein
LETEKLKLILSSKDDWQIGALLTISQGYFTRGGRDKEKGCPRNGHPFLFLARAPACSCQVKTPEVAYFAASGFYNARFAGIYNAMFRRICLPSRAPVRIGSECQQMSAFTSTLPAARTSPPLSIHALPRCLYPTISR